MEQKSYRIIWQFAFCCCCFLSKEFTLKTTRKKNIWDRILKQFEKEKYHKKYRSDSRFYEISSKFQFVVQCTVDSRLFHENDFCYCSTNLNAIISHCIRIRFDAIACIWQRDLFSPIQCDQLLAVQQWNRFVKIRNSDLATKKIIKWKWCGHLDLFKQSIRQPITDLSENTKLYFSTAAMT